MLERRRRVGHVDSALEPDWYKGNYQSSIEDLKRRKGADADPPHQSANKKPVRA